MRVLMMTQFVDENDWLVGFIPAWLRALATQVEQLDVITLGFRATDLPANVKVYSLGKEHGAGRLARLRTLRQHARALVPQADIIFSHLSDTYPLLLAPWARRYRVPMTMWYTHKQVSWRLRVAETLVQRIYTASAASLTLPTPKAKIVGHGIDTTLFSPTTAPREPQRLVTVGRVTPIKHLHVLLEALAQLPTAMLTIIGAPATAADQAYDAQLKAQAKALGIADRIEWAGGLRQVALVPHLQNAQVAVNLCPTGGMDKAVLEALACETNVVVVNQTFRQLLDGVPYALTEPDAVQVAAMLKRAMKDTTSNTMLRQRVVAGYSVERLAAVLTTDFKQLLK